MIRAYSVSLFIVVLLVFRFIRYIKSANIFHVYFDMHSHLKNTYCTWGYLVSELVFVSRKYKIYWQILFYTFLYGKRSVYNLFPRTQNKYIKVNQKPDISSNIKLSARLYRIMSGIATLSFVAFQKCSFNCLIFQIVLASICFIRCIEFEKYIFNCLNLLDR